jgi:hypothetical protein
MSIKFSLLLLFLAVILLIGFPVSSIAGNPGNASDSGNVTGLVICEDKDSETNPLPVDEISIAINSDGCTCEFNSEFNSCKLEDLDCDEDNPCSVCLGSLKRHGLSVTRANAFFGTDESESEFLYYHFVEGNAGPFIDRMGSCPCSDCPPD